MPRRRVPKSESPIPSHSEEDEHDTNDEEDYEEDDHHEDDEQQEGEEEDLGDPPTEINPYETLSLPTTCTPTEIRAAYRRLALLTHPDKAAPADKDAAHVKFQQVAFAYAILSDENRRARYDRTGRTDEGLEDEEGFDWGEFYRGLYDDVVTGETLEEFKRYYQGSDEETTDILTAYTAHTGSLDALFESVMLSDPLVDEDRFRSIIDAAITDGRVEAYPAYTGENAASRQRRVKKAEKEARQAEDLARKMGVYEKLFGKEKKGEEKDGEEEEEEKKGKGKKGKAKKKETNPEDDPDHPLAKLIRGRQNERLGSNFLDNLEKKYGGGSSRKGKRDAPTEEEFEAARQGVGKKSKRTKK